MAVTTTALAYLRYLAFLSTICAVLVATSAQPLMGAAVTDGYIEPAFVSPYCNAAGRIICQDELTLSSYINYPSGTRDTNIETINDFQRDFFLQKDFVKGGKMNLHDNLFDPIPRRDFLNSSVARTLPSLVEANLPAVLKTFNIRSTSNMATMVATTLFLCGNKALPGEERHCPTSVEDMYDFVLHQLGGPVIPVATSGAPKAAPSVKSPVTILSDENATFVKENKIVICHNVMFPSQVHYCHTVANVKVVTAALQAADGSTIQAAGICHIETSMWASSHPAFKALHIPRGDPACHWLVANDIAWIPANSSP